MAEVFGKRVAVILPPREGFGPQSAGAIALLQARLAASAGAGFTVTIVGAPQKGAIFPLPFRAAEERWSMSSLFGGGDARYAAAVARVLRGLSADLIEVHNRPDLARRLAARFPARRIALFLHNDPRAMRGAKTAAARAALSRTLGAVVCVSRFLSDAWMEGSDSGVPVPRILPNSLDLAALPPSPSSAERDRVILFAGRVVADKGADSFVRACAEALPQLPGWRAVMIGADRFRPDSPETSFTESLRAAADKAGIERLGYRDHVAVMAALSRAAIAVVPSRWQEPFGLAALEAMAAGAALVSSHRGGLAELALGASVAIDPDDVSGIAAALVGLARDPARLSALSQAGQARARAYDVPEARRRLDALRMELLTS
ncbi:glycosyltransferase family 4 protein [Acidisoma silvae]|uniref:Glycosyltransferase family 4 protein n=1 Tax=Acidisoma silvae TaxID=2802396 RepID=A0A963YRJ8_9PROT|nr:glycosyltransferase family 4 protein [Acidisoma silvae]MCB8875424.1 glycosyltransferase family 4 protein [Acidisoma silvae]